MILKKNREGQPPQNCNKNIFALRYVHNLYKTISLLLIGFARGNTNWLNFESTIVILITAALALLSSCFTPFYGPTTVCCPCLSCVFAPPCSSFVAIFGHVPKSCSFKHSEFRNTYILYLFFDLFLIFIYIYILYFLFLYIFHFLISFYFLYFIIFLVF